MELIQPRVDLAGEWLAMLFRVLRFRFYGGLTRKIDISDSTKEEKMPQDDESVQEVPEGWEKRTSRSTGMVYYLNVYTKGKTRLYWCILKILNL